MSGVVLEFIGDTDCGVARIYFALRRKRAKTKIWQMRAAPIKFGSFRLLRTSLALRADHNPFAPLRLSAKKLNLTQATKNGRMW